jgi:hypothetical protein
MKKKKSTGVRVATYLPEQILQIIQAECKYFGGTPSGFIRALVLQYFNEVKK